MNACEPTRRPLPVTPAQPRFGGYCVIFNITGSLVTLPILLARTIISHIHSARVPQSTQLHRDRCDRRSHSHPCHLDLLPRRKSKEVRFEGVGREYGGRLSNGKVGKVTNSKALHVCATILQGPNVYQSSANFFAVKFSRRSSIILYPTTKCKITVVTPC